jgi:hypothetical protein
MTAAFWDRKGVLIVEFMQQGAIKTSEVYWETLNKLRRAGHSEQRASPWQCASAYEYSSHSSTAGAYQLGVVWLTSLQPWSHSEQVPSICLLEELVGNIGLQ